MEHTIQAEKRILTGSNASATIRAEGKMPAVVYGEGKEALMITLNTKEFEKMWHLAGESTVLTITGLGEDKSVLIQDVTLDPFYDLPMHADFYLVQKNVIVDVEVPLVFIGVSPAEKSLGGTLIKVMHTINIEALPKDLPSEITVDISTLITFEDQIQIKDIVLPAGVTAIDDSEEVVALVQEPKVEEEIREEIDLSQVEVVKKGKEVEPAE